MKKQWKLTAAILYGGVMMFGATSAAGASSMESEHSLQARTPNNSVQGEAQQWNVEPQDDHGHGHVHRHRHRHGKRPGGLNHHLNEKVARLLGITPVQLEKELGQGKSLAEVAKSKGIQEDQLIDKLKNEMTVDLKRLVNRKGPITFDRKSGTSNEAQLKQ
ncbi:hypothetical protein [Paenibacillus sp. BT-177]|uniref:hypothetical protein n=1 Tax=Paenibacillus sp. BT-177 TaxID=2986930 RepID=UPI0021F6D42C|nr:hypothetical protein [Paenibacillus sp. BT-177]